MAVRLSGFVNAPDQPESASAIPNATLTAGIDAVTTTIPVSSVTYLPASGTQYVILIGTEKMLVTSRSGLNLTVQRNYDSSIAAVHSSGANVWNSPTASEWLRMPRSMTLAGDMEYLDANGAPASLAAPANGIHAISWNSGIPSWQAITTATAQNANLIYAGPATGSAAVPTFRSLVAADIPSLSYGNLSGTLTAPQVLFATGTNTVGGSTNFLWRDADQMLDLNPAVTPPFPFALNLKAPFIWGSDDNGPIFDLEDAVAGGGLYINGTSYLSAKNDGGSNLGAITFSGTLQFDGAQAGDIGIYLTSYTPTTSTNKNVTVVGVDNDYKHTQNGRWMLQVIEGHGGFTAGYPDQVAFVGINTLLPEAVLHVINPPTDNDDDPKNYVLSLYEGRPDQVADLARWKLTGGSTLTKIDKDGIITAPSFVGNLNASSLSQGTVPLARLSALTTTQFASANISQWTNDASYTTLAAVASVGYATATSATAFTNKTGNISQWTNDSNYTTLAAVAGVGYLTSVTAHNLLSTTHGDALADSVVRGDLLYGNSTPKWARLPKPSVLSDLSHDGTDVSWVTATGTGSPVRAAGPAFSGEVTHVHGTIATALSPWTITETRNASGIVFPGIVYDVTETASASNSVFFDFKSSGVRVLALRKDGALLSVGQISTTGLIATSGGNLAITDDTHSILLGTSSDVVLRRDAANVLAQRNGAAAQESRVYGHFVSATSRAYGAVQTALAAVTLTGASTATGNIIPAGCFLIGVATTTTTTITGASGYQVGDGSDADRWGDITGTAVGTDTDNSNSTANPTGYVAAASAVTLTAKTSNFTGGVVQVVVFFVTTGAD